MIKLLSKSDIDAHKATDKKREVDEGLKLARRVDSLREIQAAEEKSLRDFKVKTLAAIHAETSEASTKLDTVKQELAAALIAKAEALKPIDEERDKINSLRLLLVEDRVQLDIRTGNVEKLEKITIDDSRFAEENLAQSKVVLAQAKDTLRDANSKEQVAQEALTSANGIQARVTKNEKESLEKLNSIELGLTNRDKAQKIRDVDQDLREQSLNEREGRLFDREQTLARDIKRHGN